MQGDGGAITITPDDGDVHIAPDGTISSVSTASATRSASCKVVDFANRRALTKEGANLYSTSQTPTTPANVNIRQGMLEASNVQPVIEISHMIEVMRAYQATASSEPSPRKT